MIVTIIRTTVLYLFVTIGIRLMGKRQIGDMQPNELVVTLLISEIAAIPLQDTTQPLINGIVAIFILVILEIIISVFAMKFYSVRKMMSGKSAFIITNGKINQSAMRKVRMTVLDLIELLREQSVFDINTVAYAVLEVNGNLNVLLKSDFQPATAGDLNINAADADLQIPVISDGKIISESLKWLKTDHDRLYDILKQQELKSTDVFLMTLGRTGKMNIIKKESAQ